MRKLPGLLCLMVLLAGLLSCANEKKTNPDVKEQPIESKLDLSALPNNAARVSIPLKAEEVVQALKEKNLSRLARLVHPEQGLRLSPEVRVETDHKIFKAKELRELFRDSTIYEWGIQDGSGEPIRSTFNAYFSRYLYDADFAESDSIFYNQPQQHGNAINNVSKAYPGCVVVEYYLPGIEEEMMGLDWRALRLVFEPYEGDWYLVGIVHASWTP